MASALGGLWYARRAYTDDGLTGVLEAYGRTAAQLEDVSARLELGPADAKAITSVTADLRAVEADAAAASPARPS